MGGGSFAPASVKPQTAGAESIYPHKDKEEDEELRQVPACSSSTSQKRKTKKEAGVKQMQTARTWSCTD